MHRKLHKLLDADAGELRRFELGKASCSQATTGRSSRNRRSAPVECGDSSPLSQGDLSPSNGGKRGDGMGCSRLAPAPSCPRDRSHPEVRRRQVACAKAVTRHRTPNPSLRDDTETKLRESNKEQTAGELPQKPRHIKLAALVGDQARSVQDQSHADLRGGRLRRAASMSSAKAAASSGGSLSILVQRSASSALVSAGDPGVVRIVSKARAFSGNTSPPMDVMLPWSSSTS